MSLKNFSRRAALTFLSISFLAASARAQQPSLISGPVSDSQRVTIKNSVHPLARPEFDLGPLDSGAAMERMILVLGGSAEQERELKTFLDAQQTRGALVYHQWLTPEDFAQRFAPSSADVEQVKLWLQQKGFRIDQVARSRRWVQFSGNVKQVQAAFATEMHRYSVQGATHVANASEISIPRALANVVRGVSSLHDFFKKPGVRAPYQHLQPQANGSFKLLNPETTFPQPDGTLLHALSPGDYANIFGLSRLAKTGSGQTIAVVGRSNIDLHDIADFERLFGMPNNQPHVILSGTDPGFDPNNGDAVEATLDAEWALAMAPGATLDFVASNPTLTTDGVDLSAMFIVDNNLASVMTTSFGQCERLLGPAENAFFNSLWQQASAQGISVLVSAGDSGGAGCDDPNDPNNVPANGGLAVSGLASTAFNTAVGGTAFNEGREDATFWNATNSSSMVSAIGYIPEVAWNESCNPNTPGSPCAQFGFSLFAGSGGASTLHGKPSWQTGSGVPNDGHRDIPDISMPASGGHDPYLICFGGSCTPDGQGNFFFFGVGGTSAATPSFAGIMALINEGLGRQGLANYVLYPLAAAENFAGCNSSSRTNPNQASNCVFNDVTSGNTDVPGQKGFAAVQGFDMATGLGSVNIANLYNGWAAAAGNFQGTKTSLQAGGGAAHVSVQHGQSVPITINVAAVNTGSNRVPSGSVSLNTNKTFGAVPGTVSVLAGALDGAGNFSGPVSNLPGGQYNLTANYPGDFFFARSISNSVPFSVTPEGSSISLQAFTGFDRSGNPIQGTTAAYGDFLDLRSVVTAASGHGFATGSVHFSDNGRQFAQLNLNSQGQTEFLSCATPVNAPVCLNVGTHTVSATYSGDNSFNSSGPSVPITLTISKGNPQVLVIPTPASTTAGQQVQLQAGVFGSGTILPTGTIQFLDGSTALGSTQQLDSSNPPQVTISVSLPQGKHSIAARYSGDSTYNAAASLAAAVTVAAPFQLFANSSAQTVNAGQTASYSVSVFGATGFKGTVSLACTGAPAGATCSITPNSVSLNSSTPSASVAVKVATTQQALLQPMFRNSPLALAGLFGGVLFGRRRKTRRTMLSMLGLLMLFGMIACGGGASNSPPAHTSTTSVLTVTATSGSSTSSIPLSLTIN